MCVCVCVFSNALDSKVIGTFKVGDYDSRQISLYLPDTGVIGTFKVGDCVSRQISLYLPDTGVEC